MKQLFFTSMLLLSLNSVAGMTIVLQNDDGFDQYITYHWEQGSCEKAEKIALEESMTECLAKTGSQESCVERTVRSEVSERQIQVGTRCNIFCQINLSPTPVFKNVKGCEAKAVVLDIKK